MTHPLKHKARASTCKAADLDFKKLIISVIWDIYPKEIKLVCQEDTCPPCSLEDYSQYPRPGINLNVH
jgi:hypothetical protein